MKEIVKMAIALAVAQVILTQAKKYIPGASALIG